MKAASYLGETGKNKREEKEWREYGSDQKKARSGNGEHYIANNLQISTVLSNFKVIRASRMRWAAYIARMGWSIINKCFWLKNLIGSVRAPAVRFLLLTRHPRVQFRVTSHKTRGVRIDRGFPCLIIIPPFLHTSLSLSVNFVIVLTRQHIITSSMFVLGPSLTSTWPNSE
jgi:hypothetical protein